MRRIAVIPARGGSKRIPRKNIRDFFGRPIIAYTLEAARRADLFDVIHVSTESPEVADVVERLGFRIDFARPLDLADDKTPIRDVLKFVVQAYRARDVEFDVVFRLSACAPLLEAEDLRRGGALFEVHQGLHPVLSVANYAVPIEWAYDAGRDMTLSAIDLEMTHARSQDVALKYHDAGLFSVLPIQLIDQHPVPYPHPFVGYPVGRERAVDIDTMGDWSLAVRLFTGARAGAELGNASLRLWFTKSVLEIRLPQGSRLRALRPDDVTQAYVDGLNDPRVNRFILSAGRERQTHDSVTASIADNWADDRAVLFGVFTDGVLRGAVRIHDIDWSLQCASIGIASFDESVWSLATAAIQAATRCAGELFGVRLMRAGIHPDNVTSVLAFEKAGYTRMTRPRFEVAAPHYFWVYDWDSRRPPLGDLR